MLIKILGGLLLAVGAYFAFGLFMSVVGTILTVAAAGLLIWGGLRLLKS
jgi:hypothetical protein